MGTNWGGTLGKGGCPLEGLGPKPPQQQGPPGGGADPPPPPPPNPTPPGACLEAAHPTMTMAAMGDEEHENKESEDSDMDMRYPHGKADPCPCRRGGGGGVEGFLYAHAGVALPAPRTEHMVCRHVGLASCRCPATEGEAWLRSRSAKGSSICFHRSSIRNMRSLAWRAIVSSCSHVGIGYLGRSNVRDTETGSDRWTKVTAKGTGTC